MAMSIVDDTSACLAYTDLPWFLSEFQRRGAPFGIFLNLTKTLILTSITGLSPMPFLSSSNQQALQQALDMLESKEQINGTRYLGIPIGSPDYANNFLQDKATTYETNLDRLRQRLRDMQTKSCLLRYSAAPSLAHLFAADIYYNANPTTAPLALWASNFTTRTNQLALDRHNSVKRPAYVANHPTNTEITSSPADTTTKLPSTTWFATHSST